MQRLLFVVILAIILVGLPPLVLSDTDISIANPDIPNNEVTSNMNEVRNSSASASITITMTGTLSE